MNRNHEQSEHEPQSDVLGKILSSAFRDSREGQIAEGRAMGASIVGIRAAGIIGETAEPMRPIDSVSDPKLMRPFKKWMKRNGYESHINRIK
jgi:hypothetical protein